MPVLTPIPNNEKQILTADFELVAAHYKLRELGEYSLAKSIARNNMADAKECYAAIAQELRDGLPL